MYFTHPQFKNFTLRPFARRVSEIELKNKLRQIFPNGHILFTDSGRSAFQIAIQELKLENSEMILPAYICDIFKPILKNYNIKPIYLDINLLTFNLEDSRIEDSITPQTKSILICHTYGLPNEMNKILEIAKKHNLKIIEDCAHIFPIKLSGDCAFFSFAKLFPVVNGGMLISKKPIGVKLPKYNLN
jgi:dTDP-4-amino-4,6-dideoxygalactose transaminase